MSAKEKMDFSPVLLILILLFGVVHTLEDRRCWWKAQLCELEDPKAGSLACFFNVSRQIMTGGMEKQQLSNKVDPIIKSLKDQPVDTEDINYYGFPYYLRIDLGCDKKLDAMTTMRKGLFTGLNPLVIFTIGQPVHPTLIKPQRLDITMASAPLQDDVECNNELCKFGWYIPMPILNGSVVYRIKIISNGLGMDVTETSYSINVNGLIKTQEVEDSTVTFGTMGYHFSDMLKTDHPSRPMWVTSERAPVMIIPGIPGSKAVILTASEFQHSILLEMGIESCWVGSYSCPQQTFDGMIQEAIIMESTVIIRQNQLMHRFLGHYSLLPLKAKSSGAWEKVMRSVCVRKMVPVPTAHGGKEFFYVLGGGVNFVSVYRADIADGEFTFSELQDSQGRSVCRFMSDFFGVPIHFCVIRSVSQRGDKKHSNIVVAKFMYHSYDWTYYVMIHDKDFHVRGSLPKYIPEDKGNSFIVADGMKPNSNRFVIVNGMEYNPYSRILYFWGSTLLCSFDEGQTFMFVRGFDVEESSIQSIKYFSFSYHGEFVFVTTLEQVWWGQEGVDRVAPLRPSLGWSIFHSQQMLKRQDTSYNFQHTLLTVFWDSNKNLQEVVYIEEEKRVVKREIPVAEINSYNVFTSAPPKVHLYNTHSTFEFANVCPFFWEQLENLPQPERYTRIQQYLSRPPLVTSPLELHTVASLATYQGLLHHLLRLHTEYVQDIGDPAQSPISRLLRDKEKSKDYFFYVASNELSSSGFSVEMDGFSRMYAHPEITFPLEIYLDLRGSYTFSIYISAGVPSDVSREMIKNIWLSVEVSDRDFIHVEVTREELFNRAAILHKVSISDRGAFAGQALAGEGLMPFTMLLKTSNSDIKCFQQTNLGTVAQGVQRMTVLIGCPPGKRLAFDISKTVAESTRLNKRYFDCPYPSDVPCFYYDDLFYPFFLIQDMVLGESGPFLGSYTLKIVGGGAHSRDNIRYYSDEEIMLYNSINNSSRKSLIWIYEEQTQPANRTKEGFTVLTGTNNRVCWLCQKNSPCGDLIAQGLKAPDFFFVIEVSNKGVDLSTYCDYALRFEIHVHGFPLAPSRALNYFLMGLATMVALFFCYMVFHCCGPGLKAMAQSAYKAAKQQAQADREFDASSDMDDQHY